MKPLVSVIVSTYNAERFLHGRLENLVKQTVFPATEIIVVNSGSKQGEEAIVRDFQKRYHNIVYLSTPERETIYKAWNRGIAMARGKYIVNANTDDRTRNDGIESFVRTLEANPDVAMVYADQYVTSSENCGFEEASRGKRVYRYPFSRLRLLAGYFFGSQQMWRSSLHHVDGMWFDERFEVAGDYEFACQVSGRYRIMLVEEVLGVYYLSRIRINKQYQDVELFLREDSQVRQKYVRPFLDSLPDDDFQELYERMNFWIAVPRYVYTLIHRSLDAIDPRRQIMDRIFWCWLGSHMEEKRGDLRRAQVLCQKCLQIPAAAVIRYRYQQLMDNYAKELVA